MSEHVISMLVGAGIYTAGILAGALLIFWAQTWNRRNSGER